MVSKSSVYHVNSAGLVVQCLTAETAVAMRPATRRAKLEICILRMLWRDCVGIDNQWDGIVEKDVLYSYDTMGSADARMSTYLYINQSRLSL